MSDIYVALTIAVCSIVTAALRFLPFVIFGKGRATPKAVVFLGKFLPCAIMAMLVVYCLKQVSFLSFPYGIPELISVLVVALLHIWRRNTLLSVTVGTVCYMLLVQLIF